MMLQFNHLVMACGVVRMTESCAMIHPEGWMRNLRLSFRGNEDHRQISA